MRPPTVRIGVRLAAVAGLTLATGALALGGNALPVAPERPAPPVEASGRTLAVCPPGPLVHIVSTSTWGSLEAGPQAGAAKPVPLGRSLSLTDQAAPVVVAATDRQSQSSAGATFAREADGRLALARCAAPATSSWFTGLLASPPASAVGAGSELLLVNPDEGPAQVDLRFFGRHGLQSAPGGRGLTVPGGGTRTVAVASLFTAAEPVGVEVRTNRGRVAAFVRRNTTVGGVPAGTDWQSPSVAPATEQYLAGVPSGPGARDLVLSNPGTRRTTAHVEVLGPDGTFAPVDAAELDVNDRSTASVALRAGLAGETGTIRVTSAEPLVATVVSRGADDPAADIAVQPASGPLAGTALGAVGIAPGVRGEVAVGNAGTADALVELSAVGADGSRLMLLELPVRAGTTARWEIQQIDQPAAVTVRAPAGARLYAGIVLTGEGAGLATAPLSMPEQASAGVDPRHDPGVG